MSGETEKDVSSWTTDSLHVHILRLLAEMDRRLNQHIDALGERNEQRFESLDKAVTKAETATEKRFESVNEFRSSLADQAATLVSRAEYQTKIDGMNERLADFASRLDRRDGSGSGRKDMWGWVVGAVGFALTLLSIVAMIVKFSGTVP